MELKFRPMRSRLSRTARIRCVQEFYAFFHSENRVSRAVAAYRGGTVTSRRGRETLAHGYTRPPASLDNEVGGLSTALGLYASLPVILSTESVVVMEWKVRSTFLAASTEVYGERPPGLQSLCSCPSTP